MKNKKSNGEEDRMRLSVEATRNELAVEIYHLEQNMADIKININVKRIQLMRLKEILSNLELKQ